jgi:hypothetical protein
VPKRLFRDWQSDIEADISNIRAERTAKASLSPETKRAH